MLIDGIDFTLKRNSILTLTPSHRFSILKGNANLLLLQFNESFYCVEKHDREVSCIGYIFYGSSNIKAILLSREEQKKFSLLIEIIEEEFQNKDNIQGEMLTVLLKRLIIKCTRLARKQHYGEIAEESNHSIVRQFNILVEVNFKEQHTVKFYADNLNLSPKNLSKILSGARQPNPIALIHKRLLVEASRQILYSNKTIKEIAYELNFTDVQTFSRFFKLKQGISPQNFRQGKTAN